MNSIHDRDPGANSTILIVEDHEVLRASLRDLMNTAFPAFSIQEAKSGEEALAMALAQRPDTILMDIDLPGMNGIETARCIKKNLPQARLVMLITYENPEYRADAEAAGASAYVLKRKMGNELIPVVTNFLSHQTDTALENLEIEELGDL